MLFGSVGMFEVSRPDLLKKVNVRTFFRIMLVVGNGSKDPQKDASHQFECLNFHIWLANRPRPNQTILLLTEKVNFWNTKRLQGLPMKTTLTVNKRIHNIVKISANITFWQNVLHIKFRVKKNWYFYILELSDPAHSKWNSNCDRSKAFRDVKRYRILIFQSCIYLYLYR